MIMIEAHEGAGAGSWRWSSLWRTLVVLDTRVGAPPWIDQSWPVRVALT